MCGGGQGVSQHVALGRVRIARRSAQYNTIRCKPASHSYARTHRLEESTSSSRSFSLPSVSGCVCVCVVVCMCCACVRQAPIQFDDVVVNAPHTPNTTPHTQNTQNQNQRTHQPPREVVPVQQQLLQRVAGPQLGDVAREGVPAEQQGLELRGGEGGHRAGQAVVGEGEGLERREGRPGGGDLACGVIVWLGVWGGGWLGWWMDQTSHRPTDRAP